MFVGVDASKASIWLLPDSGADQGKTKDATSAASGTYVPRLDNLNLVSSRRHVSPSSQGFLYVGLADPLFRTGMACHAGAFMSRIQAIKPFVRRTE
jgi:hypothetical protein